ncbi:MAG: capsular polysaccharide synthesis protein [Clostridium fessum]
MLYTNLSDLLRVNLLAIYGGMWIDATVYVVGLN